MASRVYALALELLLGLASQVSAGEVTYTAPSLVAKACAKATPGTRMVHVRYGVEFVVRTQDATNGRVFGTFPGTPHGDAVVPVKCLDLVRLDDIPK